VLVVPKAAKSSALMRSLIANNTVNINAALGSAHTFDNSTATGRILMANQLVTRTTRDDAGALSGSVNSLNNLREGDETNTPLEFVYEAADCKLFYTRGTWSDPRALWKHAVDVQWRGGKCGRQHLAGKEQHCATDSEQLRGLSRIWHD
jgi:hypothetical protein